MAQQVVDPKFGGAELGNVDATPLPRNEKQSPLAVKKTPLRDLQNQNNNVPHTFTGESIAQKGGAAADMSKVSGIKRPSIDSTVSSPHHQSLSSNGANGQLVYVRRKSDEVVKNSIDETSIGKDDGARRLQSGFQDESALQDPPINESKMPRLPAAAPISTTPAMSFPSGNPLVPPLIKPLNGTVTAESRHHPFPADQRKTKLHWEERYLQLQMYLKNIDQSSQEDYAHSLRNLSSSELSRHAVELEKRAIQLSLEEGKELERVKALNVLGKSMKSSSSPASVQHHLSSK